MPQRDLNSGLYSLPALNRICSRTMEWEGMRMQVGAKRRSVDLFMSPLRAPKKNYFFLIRRYERFLAQNKSILRRNFFRILMTNSLSKKGETTKVKKRSIPSDLI